MKRRGWIIVLLIAAVLLALLVSPAFFKKQLTEATKATLNRNLNATVDFKSLKVSFIKEFPKASVEIEELIITGRQEFEGDTLFVSENLKTKFSLLSLLSRDSKSVEEIHLFKPHLLLIVNEEGAANWDVTGSTRQPNNKQTSNSDKSTFKLKLEKITIEDASLLYQDQQDQMKCLLSQGNLNITGNMYGSTAVLETEGNIGNVLLEYKEKNYVNGVHLQTQTVINVDYEKMVFSIAESDWLVNNLAMKLAGGLAMPSDTMEIDLNLSTTASDFENFLALVPESYSSLLDNIESTGSAGIKGGIKGYWYEENYPQFEFSADVTNATFRYSGYPEKVKDINAAFHIVKPQGILNLTEIAIDKATATIKNNPVNLTMNLENLMEDTRFKGNFKGRINFDHLKDVIPLDSVEISGIVDAQLGVEGSYSAISKEKIEQIKSEGGLELINFEYGTPQLRQKIMVPKGKLTVKGNRINLNNLNLLIGSSDFSLQGTVSNYLKYLLQDGILQGDLALQSQMVNLNELLLLKKNVNNGAEGESVATGNTGNQAETKQAVAFSVPENLNMTFRSTIDRVMFDRLPITNVRGLITAREGKILLNGLNMNMLDGEMILTGSYANSSDNFPFVDFGLQAKEFDIPLAWRTVTGLQRMIPIGGKSEGRVSTSIQMKGRLSPEHKLVSTTIDGNGTFSTKGLHISNSPLFTGLSGILKPEKLREVSVADFNTNFNIEKGNINLRPFQTVVAGNPTSISGSLNAQNLVDMRLDFQIERGSFGRDIQNILAVLPGNEKIKTVPAGVIIKGPVAEPEVKMDLSQTRKTITDASKGELQNSLNKLGDSLKKLFDR